MRRLFEAALGGLAMLGAVLLSPVLRPWYRRWGATADEDTRALPGDGLMIQPRLTSTRAVTIRASSRIVWAWLSQIGQGRAGFYSYDLLETMAGLDSHNAERLLPSLQAISVGDRIYLGRHNRSFFSVAAVDRRHSLVLRGGDENVSSVWTFALDTLPSGDTRLVVRDRTYFPRTLGSFVIWRVLTDPIHFIMERKMLLGIKARAERTHPDELREG
ncbi:hypothetical protein [Haliangium sp.]|uniref:hypothetical protein n=1 Tax=Haliangium sp. TaxID=2663208 RepID=UPI003D120B51